MATEINEGIKRILLYRVLGDKEDATRLALQEEHEVSSSRDTDSKITKDGSYVTLSPVEQEISATTYLSVGDIEIDKLKDAQEDGTLIELWDVDINQSSKNESGKYKATYYQAYLSEINESAPSDDAVEIELTFQVTGGVGQRGYTALSVEQEELAQFLFVETHEETTSSPSSSFDGE